MLKKEALIIFVRKPELGKVKTRLAAAVGDKAALKIYQKLLNHTCAITSGLPLDKYVFYVDAIVKDDQWKNGFIKGVQSSGDLGSRMRAAFAQLFQKGYTNICIIGSDCCELSSEIIKKAFHLLDSHDLVVGPAHDGGYYLLGMRNGIKEVFSGIDWSTEKVLTQTKEIMQNQHYTFTFLPVLSDVDTIEDVPLAWREEIDVQTK